MRLFRNGKGTGVKLRPSVVSRISTGTGGSAVACWPIGSFSNDDRDGNQDVKKAIGLDKQKNNSARESRFLVHFFTVLTRLRREIA